MRLKDFKCVLCGGALSWAEGYERPKRWQAECRSCNVKYSGACKSRAEAVTSINCWMVERFNAMSEQEREQFIKTRKEDLAAHEVERQKWLAENQNA